MHTRRSPTTVTYTRRINTIDSPDDEHRGARNMYRIGISIYENRNVRQVDYSQELNRDARSTEHKIRLTLRLVMSYIYGAPILDVSRSHTTTQHSR